MCIRLIIDLAPNGERWAMLEENGMPLFYPTLFNTTRLRNARKATSTQEQYLTAIKVLYENCERVSINLHERIKSKKFLTPDELDGLSDACRKKKRGVKQSKVVSLKKGYSPPMVKVADTTHYLYLRRIAEYVQWLAETLLGFEAYSLETANAIEKLVTAIQSRGSPGASRSGDDNVNEKGLTDEQETLLFQILQPRAKSNPFKDTGVQVRNYYLARLIAVTGARGAEILNIRIGDIDWEARTLRILRRADSPHDTRKHQPRAKTNQRIIPLTQGTLDDIREYVVQVRKRIPNASTHGYLFVSHKSGPSQGQPLSLSSLQEMFAVIRRAQPKLNITAHDLRHRWNWNYSEVMQHQKKIGHIESEQLRNVLAGWSPTSKMGHRYNKLHIRKRAHEAALRLAAERDKALAAVKHELENHG